MRQAKTWSVPIALVLSAAFATACEFEPSITPIVWPTDQNDPSFGSPLAPTVSSDQTQTAPPPTIAPATVDVAPSPVAPKAGTYAPGSRERAVQEAIDAGEHQRAIELVVDLYNIDISDAAGIPQYKEDISGGYYGATNPVTGEIEIGPRAMDSPATLATTIGHETVHTRQIAEGRLYMTVDEDGWPVILDQQGLFLNQLEAFVWELEHAEEYGLPEEEIEFVEEFVDYYYELLTDENRALVDEGIYQLPESESVEP